MTGSSKLIFGLVPICILLILFAMPVNADITVVGYGYNYNLTNVSSEASGFFSASNFFNWINASTVFTTQTCGVDLTNNSQTINVSSDVTNIRYSLYVKTQIAGYYEPSVLNATVEQKNFTNSSWLVIDDYDFSGSGLCLVRNIAVNDGSDFISNNKKQFRITLNVSQDPSGFCAGVGVLSCDGGYWGTSPYPNRALINFSFRTIVNITNCSGGGTPFLNFAGKDEKTNSAMNYSQDMTITLSNSSGNTDSWSFEFRNQTNYSICIYPSFATYQADSTSKYFATGYSTRYHYLDNATPTSTTQNISLYLLNSSDSTLITMLVKDQVENPVEDEIILIQKQDLGTGTYNQVAEAKSDFSGYAYTYLQLHENYKFFLLKDGVVEREYEPMPLESSSLTFYISQVDIPEYFSYYNKVATSCTNVSNNWTCSWIDTSGLTADMNLYVGRIDQAGETSICDYTDSGASGTFVCDLSGGGNFRYVLKGTYHSDPITYIWQSGYIGGASVVDFGVVGLILTLLVVMFVAYMTHNDVKLCLVSTAFALIFCSVISLIRFGADAMAMTFTVGIISGIVAFKIRF